MDVTTLIMLRLLHIATGVFWAGAMIYLAAFVIPAVKASGTEGAKFMQHLSMTNRLPLVMSITASVAIISGFWMLWIVSSGFHPQWMGSLKGILLSTGGLTGTAAYVTGIAINKPSVEKMAKIGAEIAQAGGPPNSNQIEALAALRAKLVKGSNIIAVLLALTVVTMALAKYL